MTIKTRDTFLTEVFQDGQPANSIRASDIRDVVESLPFYDQYSKGWEFLYDSTYTSASPLSIPAGVATQLPNDGLRANLRHPSDFAGAWDTTDNKLKPALLNGFGVIRLSFTAYSTQVQSNNYFDVDVVTGTAGSPASYGGSPLEPGQDWIFKETKTIVKGSGPGNHQHYNIVIPLFVGSAFADSGAIFYITPLTDLDVYDIAITAHRTFVPIDSII